MKEENSKKGQRGKTDCKVEKNWKNWILKGTEEITRPKLSAQSNRLVGNE